MTMTSTTTPNPDEQLSVGEIVAEIKRDPLFGAINKAGFNYACEKYGIVPFKRAGIARLYKRSQISEIKGALRRIGTR